MDWKCAFCFGVQQNYLTVFALLLIGLVVLVDAMLVTHSFLESVGRRSLDKQPIRDIVGVIPAERVADVVSIDDITLIRLAFVLGLCTRHGFGCIHKKFLLFLDLKEKTAAHTRPIAKYKPQKRLSFFTYALTSRAY